VVALHVPDDSLRAKLLSCSKLQYAVDGLFGDAPWVMERASASISR
jgi:hypothetical protein